MSTRSIIFVFIQILLIISCRTADDPKPTEFTLMSINIQNILCEIERYDDEGNVADSYTGDVDFRTYTFNREDISFESLSEDSFFAYTMTWENVEDAVDRFNTGELSVVIDSNEEFVRAYFEFDKLLSYTNGEEIYLQVDGEIHESSSINPTGLYFESEGETFCVEIISLLRETYDEQGNLSTQVVAYDCTEDSYIDLFLNE